MPAVRHAAVPRAGKGALKSRGRHAGCAACEGAACWWRSIEEIGVGMPAPDEERRHREMRMHPTAMMNIVEQALRCRACF